jgi:ketosteroid isomerase-like protein
MQRLPGKTRIVRGIAYLGFSYVFFSLGCNSKPPVDTPAADEAAVRQTDENWSKAAQSKKVDDWVAFYSKNAVLLPPNDKKVDTQKGIRKYIGELLAAPGLAINWQPTTVQVARSGDLGYTQGTYTLTVNDVHGKPTTDQGKTLEIWKKQGDGSWKCIVDMWSSDLPPTAQ